MLAAMLRFEMGYHFRQISFRIAALLFLILGVLMPFGNYGGDEIHRNAPHVDRGEKSPKVRANAAAEGDHQTGTIGTALRHLFGELFHVSHALVGFPPREKQGVEGRVTERGSHAGAMQIPHSLLSNHENAAMRRR